MLVVADVLDKCVNFSKANQNDVSSVWRDCYHLRKLKKLIGRLHRAQRPQSPNNARLYPRLHTHHTDLSNGRFKGVALRKLGMSLRTAPPDANAAAALSKAIARGKMLAKYILDRMDDELGPTPVELLMRHGLNFSHINADNPQDAALNEPFLALAHHLSSTGARHTTLRFPKAQGDGEPDEILLDQFRLFKKRYVDNVRRRPSWIGRSEDGLFLKHQAVMETFMDRAQGLHQGIPDVMEIIEIVAVSSRSQADTTHGENGEAGHARPVPGQAQRAQNGTDCGPGRRGNVCLSKRGPKYRILSRRGNLPGVD